MINSDVRNLFPIQVVRTILLTTTLFQSFLTSSIAEFAIPSFSSMETLIDPNDYFMTMTISKFQECTKLCYSTNSCVFGNYRIHGHVCYLTHIVGNTPFTIKTDKRAGFVSWTKLMLNTIYFDNNSPCQRCINTYSCKTNYDLGTCYIYACEKPPNPSSFNINGNVYTVGGKLTYGTCNGGSDVNFITCGDDGVWEGLHGYCGFSGHTLSDGSNFIVKIVHANVDQETALSNCQQEGANLTTVFTLEKLKLFKSLFGSSTEDYWVDARRFNDTEWQTSDGRSQPLTSDIWAEYTPNPQKTDNCTRMRYARQHRLDDIGCDQSYSYICEIQLQL